MILQIKNITESSSKKGFIALTSVILICAVLLYITISISLQAIDEGQISTAHEQSKKAQSMAEGCADYALMQIMNDSAYVATDEELNSDFDDGSCTFSVDPAGFPKTIQITSIAGQNNYTSQIEIVVSTTTPEIEITSWDSNADF